MKSGHNTINVVCNLSDGDIYTKEEIAFLADINCKDVDRILSLFSKSNLQEFVGDGSGVIYIMDIKYDTIVDGEGFRNTVYCAKCNIQCSECQNPQSWNIYNGRPITVNQLAELLLENGSDITFSGGECSLQAKAFTRLAKILKQHGRTIWMYSGNVFEKLVEKPEVNELLQYIDVLVDGNFVHQLRDTKLLFRGSSNQRLIDVQKTLQKNEIVLCE